MFGLHTWMRFLQDFWLSRPDRCREGSRDRKCPCAKPFCVVMTHHTAKANLEKAPWPPEAIG